MQKILGHPYISFSYIIYYFSGILISKKLWLYNDKNDNSKLLNYINLQKSIIHTVVDLLNTLYEAANEQDKNYLRSPI